MFVELPICRSLADVAFVNASINKIAKLTRSFINSPNEMLNRVKVWMPVARDVNAQSETFTFRLLFLWRN